MYEPACQFPSSNSSTSFAPPPAGPCGPGGPWGPGVELPELFESFWF